MRLKEASITLMVTLAVSIITRGLMTFTTTSSDTKADAGITAYLRNSTLKIASNMFVAGPPAADIAMSRFGFLKL